MPNVTRNSKGLVDALFDNIDNLNAKKIDSEQPAPRRIVVD